jgi:H/ACA ribonucleoprotein complex subunit 4
MEHNKKPIEELLEFCIINVDKPSGMTSFKVADSIRKILNARKTGHFGTLDPKVTGVLPVALNRACKLSNYFMKKDKEYIGKMHVHKEIGREELEEEMSKFLGKIVQKPPVKSSVKRVLRERQINKFKISKVEMAKKGMIVEFHSDVQAGTYIRKLVSDLGERIGGAHMTELRRVRAGIFKEKDSHKLEEIEDAVKDWKNGDESKLRKMLVYAGVIKQLITGVQVRKESINDLLNGKPLMKEDVDGRIPNSEMLSVFLKDKFIGVYRRVTEGDIIARAEFVFN